MNAIVTKYLGPTNHRGARIRAKAEGLPAVTVVYPQELSGEQAHSVAAIAFARKMEWTGRLVAGCLPDGTYAFVFMPRDPRSTYKVE